MMDVVRVETNRHEDPDVRSSDQLGANGRQAHIRARASYRSP